MSNKTINDQGVAYLVEAIVDRTVKDFMVTTPGSDSRKLIEKEILSEHFEALTGISGNALLKQLQEQYEQKRRKGKRNAN